MEKRKNNCFGFAQHTYFGFAQLTTFILTQCKLHFYKIAIPLLLIVILAGCGNKGVTVNEYKAWFSKKDCPMTQKQEVDGYQYELRYLTADFMVFNDIPSEELSSHKLKEELKARNGLYYFLLRIIPPVNKQQKFTEEESKSISWLSFGAKDDMMVIAGKDTLHCMMNQFEPSMGVMPYQSFNIGINKPDVNSEKDPQFNLEFKFTDKANSGKQVCFTYKASDFKQIPTYKL